MDERIQTLIQRSDAIPSMPTIVTRFLEITNQSDYNVQDVVNLLSTDPGIAGDVLRLANSPLFGVARKVASLLQASNLLGIKRIRTLVMGRCMVEQISKGQSPLIDGSYYWRRSLVTGVLAARFADQIAPGNREDAFMGGLLSDIGVTVMARAFPDTYGPAASAYAPLCGSSLIEREITAVGVAHPEVGALVLDRWSLPETMVLVVKHHHDHPSPEGLPEEVAKLTRVVAGAADIAPLLCETPNAERIAPTCCEAMDVVGLNLAALQHVLKEIESDVTELAAVLHIDVISSKVYKLIADAVAEQLNAPA